MSLRVEGLFEDRHGLTRAVERLAENSVPADSIHVFVVDRAGRPTREIEVEDEAGALRGALLGAMVGAAVGFLIVVVVVAGDLGPANADILGLRTISGALRAVAICAAAGVPLGALLGMGHWQGRKRISEEELEAGRAMVVVESEDLAEIARQVLHEAGAVRVTPSPSG